MKADSKYKLQIVTQDRVLLDQDVTFVVVPSEAGPLGVLPGHAPLLGVVTIGALKVRDTGGSEFGAFVGRGFFMISHEGVVVVVRVAELEHQIDTARAQDSLERARRILTDGGEHMDAERARDALLRSKVRLQVAEKRPF